MRIHVLFDTISVLVPCGDGRISVRELIEKATIRFRKISADQHADSDNMHNMIVYLLGDNRRIYVDHDDMVADILENDEEVVVQHTSWVGNNEPQDKVIHGISESVDMQGKDRATHSVSQPSVLSSDSVNKSVLTFDISPYTSDPTPLGIRINQKKKSSGAGTTGIYITSISTDGTVAMDGRLQKNDQILSVNQHDLTGKSLEEATDILRHTFSSVINNSKIRLVVARTNKFTISGLTMGVLGEHPEELKEERYYTSMQGTHQEISSDTPSKKSPKTHYMKSISMPAQNSPLLKSQTRSLPSQQEQPTNWSSAKKSDTTWANSLPRDASDWAKQTELQYRTKHQTLSSTHTLSTHGTLRNHFHNSESKGKRQIKRRSSSFSTADCSDEFKFIPHRSTAATSLLSSMSLTKYDRPNYQKYRLKKQKSHKENTPLNLKSIQGTLTMPERKLLNKYRECVNMFPELYSKYSTLPASLRTLDDRTAASFDCDDPPPPRSKLQHHYS